MPEDKVLTTKEVAEYIKLNEKTVLKLAQYGELPGVKMGNQWRFHLTSIDQYLQKQLMDSSDEDLDIVIKTKNRPLPLSRLVDHRLIDTNITARNKKQVLSQLAKIAHSAWITPSYESLLWRWKSVRICSAPASARESPCLIRAPRTSRFFRRRILSSPARRAGSTSTPRTARRSAFFPAVRAE